MGVLSQIWGAIQETLFPHLEEAIGPLTENQQKLVSLLEVARIDYFVKDTSKMRGRKQASRVALARSFVAKSVYNLTTTRALIDYLKSCPNLRRLCGFEKASDIPSEATFSRAFEEFARSELPQRVHEALIERHIKDQETINLSRDSTAIEGNEKPVKKEKPTAEKPPKRRRGRPKKGEMSAPKKESPLERQRQMTLKEMLNELPKKCDRGTKKNSQGYMTSWNGYKLHLDCVDGQIPVSCIVTSASTHDSRVAIPLSMMSSRRVKCAFELMDAAYDAKDIKEHVRSLDHEPIIDSNPRRGEKIEFDSEQKERFKKRSSVERIFGRLKEEFGAEHVRVKGYAKVTTHLMFGVLALTVDQLLRLAP